MEALKTIKELAENQIYLVGGAVRDLYLGRELTDYDFAYAGDVWQLARAFTHQIGGTFIPLDEEHNIARVAVKLNKNTLYFDFAGYNGDNIFEDLRRRDFTINAMALPLGEGLDKLIDPYYAREDIANKTIHILQEQNIIDDPLRILRGIRIALQLNYEISSQSLAVFKEHAFLLAKVSAERVRDELLKSFKVSAHKTMLLLEEIGLLKIIFPELFNTVGVKQNKYHTLDVWHHILEVVYHLENSVFTDSNIINDKVRAYLDEDLAAGRNREVLLKLAAVLHDVAKPIVKKIHPQKGIIFWNHEHVGADVARKIAVRLMLSKKEANFIYTLVKNHMRPLFMVKAKATKKCFHKFFKETQSEGIAVVLHALADMRGGKAPDPEKEQALLKIAGNLINYYYKEFIPYKEAPLLKGFDVMEVLPELPKVKIGDVLENIETQRAAGRINSREEALNYLTTQQKLF